MQDVVRIDFVRQSSWTLPVPFSVSHLSELRAGIYPSSAVLLSVGLDIDRDALMQQNPTNKISEERVPSGVLHTHTLQIPVERGFQTIREAEKSLQENDFYVVLYTYAGTRFLLYSLPNTCQFSIEEQQGQSATMTVKTTVKSMSGAIRLL